MRALPIDDKITGEKTCSGCYKLEMFIERNTIQMKHKALTKVLMRSVVSFLIALMSDSEMSESASSMLCVVR